MSHLPPARFFAWCLVAVSGIPLPDLHHFTTVGVLDVIVHVAGVYMAAVTLRRWAEVPA